MSLERLRLFAELVSKGSYTQAAETLNVSKSFLSKQIKGLEQELGTQLLLRSTRTMRLTASGEVILEQARKLTAFWPDTKRLLQTADDSLSGEVRITAPSALMEYVLLPRLEPKLKANQHITLVSQTGNETNNLISTPYDFAVRITTTPPDDMVAFKLCDAEYVCCATPEYLSREGMPNCPEDLLDHACISLSYWQNWLFYLQGKEIQISVEGRYQFSQNTLLKQAALDGLGITRLPRYMVDTALREGQLVALLEQYTPEKRPIYLLYPQTITRPQRVTILLDAIKSAFSHESDTVN